jgi:peroxiredoxin
MKKILLFLSVMAPAALLAQHTFVITGTLKHVPAGSPYVYVMYGKGQLDSARVIDGGYVLTGQLAQPGIGNLFSVSPYLHESRDSRNHVAVFLEPANFSVEHIDSFSNIVVKGSDANIEYAKIKKQIDPLLAQEHTLFESYSKAHSSGDSAKMARLNQELISLDHAVKIGVLMNYAKNNPASPIALFALETAVPGEFDADSVGPVFDRLGTEAKKSEDGLAFEKRIEMIRNTSIGHPAPDFTQNDTLGHPVSLSSFRGNYVLIDFWASWCGPCRLENPNVLTAFNQYKTKGFRIIGISLDKPGAKDKWMAAIHQDGLLWTQVSDLQFWDNAVAKAYGIGAIPQNFLLDADGNIIAKGLRGEQLEKKLSELYNK